jgi:N-carbamoyl-L-amino-acid hydrolase
MDFSSLRINADRLNASLAELATVGATPAGGVTRLALSDEDRTARLKLTGWLKDLNLEPHFDDLGNIWAVRPGTSNTDPLLLGSHIDTVIRGGRFDGALGVLGALEVLRMLAENNIETDRPIGLVNWTNEEGVRFEPAMMSAGVVANRFTAEYVYDRRDTSGLRFGDELARIDFRGSPSERPKPGAYLELHIEQGPVLESLNVPVAVVDGIVGITWSEVTVTGQPDHAGPSPMHLRRDPMMAAAELILAVERIAIDRDPTAVATVGRIAAEANIINTIPGKVTFSADFRHQSPEILEAQVESLRMDATTVANRRSVDIDINRFWTSDPTAFDETVRARIGESIAGLGHVVHRMWSGAGHDAKYMAEICPSGMIFVRSQGGLSHCEEEFSTPGDIEVGANVLLQTALAIATRPTT